MGIDRPSPDHANADVILLISAHLEAGPLLQPARAAHHGGEEERREADRVRHAALEHRDPRRPLARAVARLRGRDPAGDREPPDLQTGSATTATSCGAGGTGRSTCAEEHPDAAADVRALRGDPARRSTRRTRSSSRRARVGRRRRADRCARSPRSSRRPARRLSTHNWRSAAAGNLGRLAGRAHALLAERAARRGRHRGRHVPQRLEQVRAEADPHAAAPAHVERADLAARVPAGPQRDVVPAAAPPEGGPRAGSTSTSRGSTTRCGRTPTASRGSRCSPTTRRSDCTSRSRRPGTRPRSSPTTSCRWGSARSATTCTRTSSTTGSGSASASRCCRAARERMGETVDDTRKVNPGEVWEENEFWIELTWRIDPDGSLGIRQHFESKAEPGAKLTVDEYYGWIFENSVPGLPEAAAAEGLHAARVHAPLRRLRGRATTSAAVYTREVPARGARRRPRRRRSAASTPRAQARRPERRPDAGPPSPTPTGRRPVGVGSTGRCSGGFPTPSGKLEFWSRDARRLGLARARAPRYIKSHVHPENLDDGQMPLISTFRLPVQIHTRSANAKWLDEIAHTNPLWIHPTRRRADRGHDRRPGPRRDPDRPLRGEGLGHRGHPPGRRRLQPPHGPLEAPTTTRAAPDDGDGRARPRARPLGDVAEDRRPAVRVGRSRHLADLVDRRRRAPEPDLRRCTPTRSRDMHCWHQAVRVRPAEPGDRLRRHLGRHRPRPRASTGSGSRSRVPPASVSPDGTRRPYWLIRPLKPGKDVFRLDAEAPAR